MIKARIQTTLALMTLSLCLTLSANAAEKKADKKAEKKTDMKLFVVNTSASSAYWKGTKVTGFHEGHIKIKEGTFEILKGELSKGTVAIDMSSIVDEDLKDPKFNAKLTGHLKSEDFFNVEKFPTATLSIAKVEKIKAGGENTHQVSGDLMIKGMIRPITFPAKISITGDELKAVATMTVDRTKYDIRYGSGKFFQGLGDKLIHDTFIVKVDLAAQAAK